MNVSTSSTLTSTTAVEASARAKEWCGFINCFVNIIFRIVDLTYSMRDCLLLRKHASQSSVQESVIECISMVVVVVVVVESLQTQQSNSMQFRKHHPH